MLNARLLLASLIITLGLVSCTGTFEPLIPNLLVVGYSAEDGEGTVALIEDRTLFTYEEAVLCFEEDNCLRFLEDSERTLPAPPIAADVIDRGFSRRELVVLSREPAPDEPAAISNAYLTFFNLTEIDPENPENFKRSTDHEQLFINELAVHPDLRETLTYCPIDVQISNEGRFVALLNNAEACGGLAFPKAVDIIDLQTETVVARFDIDIAATSFYLWQNETGNDRLYFLEEGIGNSVILKELVLPENASNPGPNNFNPVKAATIPLDTSEDAVYDLGVIGDALVALRDSKYAIIRNFSSGTPNYNPDEDDITTSRGSRRLVLNAFADTETVIILGTSDLTVHDTLEDEERASEPMRELIEGTLVPINDFAYLLREGERITKYDELSGEELELVTFNVDGLANPSFITWVQASPDEPAENDMP